MVGRNITQGVSAAGKAREGLTLNHKRAAKRDYHDQGAEARKREEILIYKLSPNLRDQEKAAIAWIEYVQSMEKELMAVKKSLDAVEKALRCNKSKRGRKIKSM